MEASNETALTRLQLADKEILLVGTAHISQASVDQVQQVIATESPDTVCVELDPQRYQALKNQSGWQSLNLVQAIRRGQLPFLLANLILASFQKRMGLQTGVRPGAELAAAAEAAEAAGLGVELVDRDIRTSLLRIWRTTGYWSRLKVMAALLGSLFENQELSEEDLAQLKQADMLSTLLNEMGDLLPSVKSVLVDERDTYMAWRIRQCPGQRVVAVVGAAHVPGLSRQLHEDIPPERVAEITTVPPKGTVAKLIPWLIPTIVIALFVSGFFFGKSHLVAGAAVAWVLTHGLLSALGALVALGHPLTLLAAFVAAPLTSLNPTVGAGMVAGLVQAMVAGPTVGDLETVGDDLVRLRGWWRNRLARVMLVFFFSSLGSSVGTFLAFHWLKDLL